MISATQRILCSIMVVLFLLNSCAPAPAATSAPAENPAVARLQQTVDALLATQNALVTPTPDSLLPTITAEVQTEQTPNFLQQTVEAIAGTQVAEQAAQQNVELQQTVDALFATQNAQSTLQQELQGPTSTPQPALNGPTPNPTCGSASEASDVTSAPVIETLFPDRGEIYGGKSVTVKGKNLISADGEKAAFCFGDFTATDVLCTNAELCTMNTPANPKAGFVDVRAIRDELAFTRREAFEYLNPPTVDLVEPNSGPLSGGTRVNIEGTGFSENTVFFFGSGNEARTEACNGDVCTVISPGLNSDQDLVVWVQAVERGAYSELDTGPSTRQTFKFIAPARYACDALLIEPATQGPFRSGEHFEIQWVVKNTGTNAWPAGQDVRFSVGSSGNMGTSAVFQIKRSVRPNETETVTIQAKAPNKKGLHYMTWVVSGMGCSLYIAVRVE